MEFVPLPEEVRPQEKTIRLAELPNDDGEGVEFALVSVKNLSVRNKALRDQRHAINRLQEELKEERKIHHEMKSEIGALKSQLEPYKNEGHTINKLNQLIAVLEERVRDANQTASRHFQAYNELKTEFNKCQKHNERLTASYTALKLRVADVLVEKLPQQGDVFVAVNHHSSLGDTGFEILAICDSKAGAEAIAQRHPHGAVQVFIWNKEAECQLQND